MKIDDSCKIYSFSMCVSVCECVYVWLAGGSNRQEEQVAPGGGCWVGG